MIKLPSASVIRALLLLLCTTRRHSLCIDSIYHTRNTTDYKIFGYRTYKHRESLGNLKRNLAE